MRRLFWHLLPLVVFLQAFPASAAADQLTDFSRIQKAISSGNLLEAQSRLEDFLDEYSSGRRVVKALYLLGQIHYQRAEYAEAVEDFSKFVSEYPESEYADGAQYGLALSQIGMLDYSNAIKSLELFLATQKDSDLYPSVLYWLAESLYRREDYAQALLKYDKFLKSYHSHGLREYALDSSAWCLEQLGQYDKAIVRRRAFLKEFQGSSLAPAAAYCLAADLAQTGDRERAANQYAAIMEQGTEANLREQATLRTGLLYADLGRDSEAIAALERIGKKPVGNDFCAPAVLGGLYLKAGRFQNARETLEGLPAGGDLSRDPSCRTDLALSLAYFGLGDFEKAAAAVSVNTVEKDPAFQEIRGLVPAVSLLNVHKPDAAAERIGTLLKAQEPGNRLPHLLFLQAKLLLLSHQYRQAEEILSALSKNPDFSSGKPALDYCLGFSLYQDGKYAAASEKFQSVSASKEPKSLARLATYLLADSYNKSGDWEKAFRGFKSFLENWANDALARPALYRQGILALLLKKYDVAPDLFVKYVTGHPRDVETDVAEYGMGLAYLSSGNPEKSARVCGQLLDMPVYDELADNIALAAGLAEFDLENYRQADRLLHLFQTRYPDSDVRDAATFFAAASKYQEQAIEPAEVEFRRFLELFPGNNLASHALVLTARCEEKLNHPDVASRLYEAALKGDMSADKRAAASMGLAYSQMSLGNMQGALTALAPLTESQQPGPATEGALFWQGRLQYALGRWLEAASSLGKLANLFPASRLADDALFFSARAARAQADYAGAVRAFQKLESAYPGSPLRERATIEAAECMLEAGQADAAANEFQKFIEQNVSSPLRPQALYDMGKSLQRAGRFEEAMEQFRAAAGDETTQMAASSHFAVAECLAELDRTSEAIAELVSMIRAAYPAGWAERAQLQVARLLERDGEVVEARQVYEVVAQTYKTEAAGIVAQRAIERLSSVQ